MKQTCLNCGYQIERMIPSDQKDYEEQNGYNCPECKHNSIMYPCFSDSVRGFTYLTEIMWREINMLKQELKDQKDDNI